MSKKKPLNNGRRQSTWEERYKKWQEHEKIRREQKKDQELKRNHEQP